MVEGEIHSFHFLEESIKSFQEKHKSSIDKKIVHWNSFETTYEIIDFSGILGKCHKGTLKLLATTKGYDHEEKFEILHYCPTCESLRKGYFSRVKDRHNELKEISQHSL